MSEVHEIDCRECYKGCRDICWGFILLIFNAAPINGPLIYIWSQQMKPLEEKLPSPELEAAIVAAEVQFAGGSWVLIFLNPVFLYIFSFVFYLPLVEVLSEAK